MKSILRWVQDFDRISGDPIYVEMNAVMFIEQLDTALYRTDIRKKLVDQSNKKATRFSGSLGFRN